MVRQKTTVAGSVVAQARAKAVATADFVSLDQESLSLTRLDRGVHQDTAQPFLRAVLPRQGSGNPDVHDLSFLLEFPALAEPIATAFLKRCVNLRPRSRRGLRSTLASGFFTFLRQGGLQKLAFAELRKSVFIGFVKWLDAPRANGQPLSPTTRALALYAISSTVEALEDSLQWKSAAQIIRHGIPKNQWPGQSRKIQPRERLSREQLGAIVAASEKEVMEIQCRLEEGRRLIEAGRAALTRGSRDYRDLATCVAALDQKYPAVIPDIRVIENADVNLGRAVKNVHRHATLTGYFYASSRDLVPFILLLAVSTVFNPDTLLRLKWAGVTKVDRLGSTAIRITAEKNRAAEDPVILLNATENEGIGAGLLLALLNDLSGRIRGSIFDLDHRDRVFVFVPRMAVSKHPTPFSGKNGPSSAHAWKFALKQFAASHGIEPFNISQLRPTVLDEVQYLTGDLLAAKAVGQHRNPQTAWYHYTSTGTRNRYRERVGEVLLLRERWLQTEGVIDPRVRTAAQDKGAATPGFLCFDPFDSPRPGQTPNRLCTAYGDCPSCPLAAADVGDPAAVAAYLALQDAIVRSQGPISPNSWQERWTSVAADLEGLLLQVTKPVMDEAQRYHINLPPVG